MTSQIVYNCITGPTGPQGTIGPMGLMGDRGEKGMVGPRGYMGNRGPAAEILLANSISTVSTSLAAEITNRLAADTVLANSISTVSTGLAAELTARAAANTALANSISTVTTGLATEITDRKAANTALANSISTVTTGLATEKLRIDAILNGASLNYDTLKEIYDGYTTLSTSSMSDILAIKAVNTTLANNINTVSTGLAAEITNRLASDTTLANSISTVTTGLATEITDRKAANTVLANSISTEKLRIDAITLGFFDNFDTLKLKLTVDRNTNISVERTTMALVTSVKTLSEYSSSGYSSSNETSYWNSVCWANELGLLVAVSSGGGGTNRVMTSPDGITWTGRQSSNNQWQSVCWAKELGTTGLLVAVSGGGTNRVMTSPDGITWTDRQSSNDTNNWYSVCWAKELGTTGLLVSVAFSGTNKVMTSPDGITWTGIQSSNENVSWTSVCWAKELGTTGLLVAVASNATGNRVMTSPDGITWTGRESSNNYNSWTSVCWAKELGLLVAVSSGGTNRVMTSPDGITWTGRESSNETSYWQSVCWAKELGLFVSVAFWATGNRVMTSPNGITWTGRKSSNETNSWYSVCWAKELGTTGLLVSVAYSGTNRVMTFYRNNNTDQLYINNNVSSLSAILANVDIMFSDTPFIGIQFSNNSALTTTIDSTLLNSTWTAFGSTSSIGSVFSLTNNYTRQLYCADWSFPTPADGQLCGFGSSATTGVRVSTGFNFGISAVLGYADTAYSAGLQNFFGLYKTAAAPALSSTVSITSLLNCILFGSSTTDANICIYTAGHSTMVKQVDLGSSFPSNRPLGAASTDWFKFTLYWDASKFYYKAVNNTTNVSVSGFFTASLADIPSTSIELYPQCLRAMGSSQIANSCKLKVQRFGVYY